MAPTTAPDAQEGRLLALFGPLVVLYLVGERLSRAPLLDDVGSVAVGVALLMGTLPPILRRLSDRPTRRLASLSVAGAVIAIGSAAPSLESALLEVAAAIAGPLFFALLVDLAIDAPEGLFQRITERRLRLAVWSLAAIAVGIDLSRALPPLGDQELLVPERVGLAADGLAAIAFVTALGLRLARYRVGTAPELLARSALATLGLWIAGPALALGVVLFALEREPILARAATLFGVAALVASHAMLADGTRPVNAARTMRRVVTLVVVGFVASAVAYIERHAWPTTLVGAATVGLTGTLALALVAWFVRETIERFLAPDRARLLFAIRDARARLPRARHLEDIGEAVLASVRQHVRVGEHDALLFSTMPERAVRLDRAHVPHLDARPMPRALRDHLVARPHEILVRGPLEAALVRRPELRELESALRQLDALAVVPLMDGGELEGALVVPRGPRGEDVTLEELALLEELGLELACRLAPLAAEERARLRSRDDVVRHARLEEAHAGLEQDLALARLRRSAEHELALDRPLIAYSPLFADTLAAAERAAKIDAPLALVIERGARLDAILERVHRASPRAEEPLVVLDLSLVTFDAMAGRLFGTEAERGFLELAGRGTLALIHPSGLPSTLQRRLDDALASRSLVTLDGARSLPLEAQVIVITRRPLADLVDDGVVDPDLARRFASREIAFPSLAHRAEDLASVVLLAIDRATRELGRAPLGIDDDAVQALRDELSSLGGELGGEATIDLWVGRAVVRARGTRITKADLGLGEVEAEPALTREDPLVGSLAEIERRALEHALERAAGNKSEAAKLLELKRTTFLDKLRRAGIETEPERASRPPRKTEPPAAI